MSIVFRFFIVVLLVISGLSAAASPGRTGELLVGAADVAGPGRLAIGGGTVRLYDINMPGPDTECSEWSGRHDRRYPCHSHARAALESLLGDEIVACVPRPGTTATCYVRGEDIAEILVARGWAVSCGQSGRYLVDQESARKSRKGMWAGPFDLRGLCPGGNAAPRRPRESSREP